MRVTIRKVRRCGRILAWRDIINAPALSGELRVEETRDETQKRYVRTATLLDRHVHRHKADRPELRDVALISMHDGMFSLSGIERVDDVEYAQSWIVTVER